MLHGSTDVWCLLATQLLDAAVHLWRLTSELAVFAHPLPSSTEQISWNGLLCPSGARVMAQCIECERLWRLHASSDVPVEGYVDFQLQWHLGNALIPQFPTEGSMCPCLIVFFLERRMPR